MRSINWRSPVALAIASAVLIVAAVVLREHWGHALGFLPYILLLVCPLMHLFHHGGHRNSHPPRADSSNV